MTILFEGRNIGPKQARAWNMGLTALPHSCPVCRVDCGGEMELKNHVAKRHPRPQKEQAA